MKHCSYVDDFQKHDDCIINMHVVFTMRLIMLIVSCIYILVFGYPRYSLFRDYVAMRVCNRDELSWYQILQESPAFLPYMLWVTSTCAAIFLAFHAAIGTISPNEAWIFKSKWGFLMTWIWILPYLISVWLLSLVISKNMSSIVDTTSRSPRLIGMLQNLSSSIRTWGPTSVVISMCSLACGALLSNTRLELVFFFVPLGLTSFITVLLAAHNMHVIKENLEDLLHKMMMEHVNERYSPLLKSALVNVNVTMWVSILGGIPGSLVLTLLPLQVFDKSRNLIWYLVIMPLLLLSVGIQFLIAKPPLAVAVTPTPNSQTNAVYPPPPLVTHIKPIILPPKQPKVHKGSRNSKPMTSLGAPLYTPIIPALKPVQRDTMNNVTGNTSPTPFQL